MMPPKVLLFDLGGVIVRWTGMEALSQMTGLKREKIAEKFSGPSVFSDYELGLCNDDTFIQTLITDFDLKISPERIKTLWQEWVGETYPGTKEALIALKENHTIACLSNTNALHWAWLPRHLVIENYFDYGFASHLLAAAKPDDKSYQICIEKMGVTQSDIWFFDDTLANVDAAMTLGIRAFHVDRAVGVLPVLKDLKLL